MFGRDGAGGGIADGVWRGELALRRRLQCQLTNQFLHTGLVSHSLGEFVCSQHDRVGEDAGNRVCRQACPELFAILYPLDQVMETKLAIEKSTGLYKKLRVR